MKLSLALAVATTAAEDGCDGVAVDPLRELVVVDDDAIARSGVTFRTVAEASSDPQSFARSLLEAYAEAAPDRAAASKARGTCPWLRRTASNRCDATCTHCDARVLDLDESPYRLVAVANRVDLGRAPDALSPAGEGRLVFAVTDGPAGHGGAPLAMTVIFEYALAGEAREWASRFHALSAIDRRSAAFSDELARVVSGFTATLAQVRVDDAAFGEGGRPLFAELALAGATLRPRRLRNTPDPAIDAAEIASFVRANEEAVLTDRWILPDAMRARTIESPHAWTLPAVPERTRKAFAQGTCNGCHGGEQPAAAGFHVTPWGTNEGRLSRFLRDPQGGGDELSRSRARSHGVARRWPSSRAARMGSRARRTTSRRSAGARSCARATSPTRSRSTRSRSASSRSSARSTYG
jgi:hypothetical protein